MPLIKVSRYWWFYYLHPIPDFSESIYIHLYSRRITRALPHLFSRLTSLHPLPLIPLPPPITPTAKTFPFPHAPAATTFPLLHSRPLLYAHLYTLPALPPRPFTAPPRYPSALPSSASAFVYWSADGRRVFIAV